MYEIEPDLAGDEPAFLAELDAEIVCGLSVYLDFEVVADGWDRAHDVGRYAAAARGGTVPPPLASAVS